VSAARRHVFAAASVLALVLPYVVAAVESRPDSMPLPPEAPLSYYYDAFEQSIVRPVTRALDVSLLVRKLGGSRREAANLDAQDRVLLPSTWWQPRIGFKPLSVDDMLVGAGSGTGPAAGAWTVVSAKSEGVSKGFVAKDAAGVRFAIKFDVPGLSELATSADVVASKLYWAAGYNVPDNTIAFVRREQLEIAPDATHGAGGKKVPITPAFIDELLRDVPQQPDGSYRVVTSRYVTGKPLGEWRYDGRRKGDREDLIPHELRREIRGLWTINAWLNHTDCSARNTLDMYVTDGGRSFVRHHLIDFGGCLGSATIKAQPPRSGHEYWVDFQTLARALVTLAVPPFKWERSTTPPLLGVGFFESEVFDPGAWRPYLPNPAFDQRTERDVKWGARIVAAFTDAHIRAAVEQGRYSDPRASEYLVRILEERRDKIVRRWLTAEEATEARSPSGP
jgi:hypothetical protein